MTSFQTTQAAADAAAAAAAWRHHIANCSQCANARHRRGQPYCEQGAELRRDCQQTAAELDRQRQLDAEPAPGQLELPLGLTLTHGKVIPND